jgi:hypothetical protein
MDLGALVFLCIATMAFWMLIFLLGVAVPYWITLYVNRGIKTALGMNKKDDDTTEVSA